MRSVKGPVLLYDGECGLCRLLVRLLVRADSRGELLFAPLQGVFAQTSLIRCGLSVTDFESLVFLPEADGRIFYQRTAGVVAALARLGGGWRVLSRLVALFPNAGRETIYKAVARLRYRVFGRVDYRAGEPLDPSRAERFLS